MPTLTDQQKVDRIGFIGGSDAASICGVNPYRTAYDVFLEKIGQGTPIEETEAMYWGTIHEDSIATRYSERSGRTLMVDSTTISHPLYRFMGCHPDRLERDMALEGQGMVEIKSTRKRLKKGECPDHYVIQLYHNMLCAGLTWGTVVILIQGSEMVWYDYHLTPEIEKAIVTLESRFWKAVEAKDWKVFGCE